MDSTAILVKIPMFRGLRQEQLADLVPMLEEESYPPNKTVIREGALGDSLYLIVRGSVNIFKSVKGREEMLMNNLKRNQYFGEVALIDNLPRSATVITKEASVFLRLRKKSLDRYLRSHPEFEGMFYKNCLLDTIRRYRQISTDISFFWSDLQKKNLTLEEINKDLSSAKKLQDFFINTGILDYHFYPIAGLKQSYIYNPTQEIGGDFINLTPFSEYEYGAVIADVMGHGITAALAAGAFKSAFALLVQKYGREPSSLLIQLNKHFFDNISSLFASCHYAYINLKEKTIKMARAGHYYPLFYAQEKNSLHSIKSSGSALGIIRDTEFEQVNISYSAGDKLMFFTDGIIEHRDLEGVMYSEERLVRVFMKKIQENNADILKEIEHDYEEFTGEAKREDDISLLLLEFEPG